MIERRILNHDVTFKQQKKARFVMDELLQHLEYKIKQMIDQHHQLKQANSHLNQGKRQLAHEKEVLLGKQKRAITQIESLVAKLKSTGNLP